MANPFRRNIQDNYPPGVTWRDFYDDDDEPVEETEPDDFEEFYYNLRNKKEKANNG